MKSNALKLAEAKQGDVPGRRAKFVVLAENRTINAIKAIRVIGKLGNKSAYDYTEADVLKIIKALNKEIDALRNRMVATGSRDEIDFNL